MHAAADPLMFLYVPVGQGAQGPPVGPKKPARHKQSVELLQPMGTGVKAWDCSKMQLSSEALALGDHCPGSGQSVHAAADPLMFLYVPVGQGAQGPPEGLKNPAAQVQLANEVLPAGESKLRGHLVHETAPSREYPAQQSAQVEAPEVQKLPQK